MDMLKIQFVPNGTETSITIKTKPTVSPNQSTAMIGRGIHLYLDLMEIVGATILYFIRQIQNKSNYILILYYTF